MQVLVVSLTRISSVVMKRSTMKIRIVIKNNIVIINIIIIRLGTERVG